MSGFLLSLQNISTGYGAKTVVSNVSFEVKAGEFCALLGLNGSGKTTLLKTICGLIPIKSGICMAGGMDLTALGEYKRARYISYIPQRHSKMLGVSVLDAVMMGFYSHLGPLEFPTARDRQKAMETLEKTGMSHLAEEDFSRLSEGQKQMVILARTLGQDTPVMLMDEPDSALDFLNRHRMLEEVRHLIKSEGKVGLVTLHDPNLALEYCDHLVLIHDGKVVSDLYLSGASHREIRTCLSQIYGSHTLIKHEYRYIVLSGSQQKFQKGIELEGTD